MAPAGAQVYEVRARGPRAIGERGTQHNHFVAYFMVDVRATSDLKVLLHDF